MGSILLLGRRTPEEEFVVALFQFVKILYYYIYFSINLCTILTNGLFLFVENKLESFKPNSKSPLNHDCEWAYKDCEIQEDILPFEPQINSRRSKIPRIMGLYPLCFFVIYILSTISFWLLLYYVCWLCVEIEIWSFL